MYARAGDMTAYQLIKEGNRYVGEDAKDKVVQIRSEKSIGVLTPNIWVRRLLRSGCHASRPRR